MGVLTSGFRNHKKRVPDPLDAQPVFMAALETQPTVELRAELEAAGVDLPGEDELKQLSAMFNEALDTMRRALGTKSDNAVGWHDVFREFDKDGSGVITYDEILLVRNKLKLPDLSNDTLKALWCALDADNSNQIEVNEFASFAKMGAIAKKGSHFGGAGTFAGGRAINELTSAEAIESQPTVEMRSELSAAGVELPADEALVALSKAYNEALEVARAKSETMKLTKAQGSGSWYNLFREVDEDGSGFVTFDELTVCTPSTSGALLGLLSPSLIIAISPRPPPSSALSPTAP